MLRLHPGVRRPNRRIAQAEVYYGVDSLFSRLRTDYYHSAMGNEYPSTEQKGGIPSRGKEGPTLAWHYPDGLGRSAALPPHAAGFR